MASRSPDNNPARTSWKLPAIPSKLPPIPPELAAHQQQQLAWGITNKKLPLPTCPVGKPYKAITMVEASQIMQPKRINVRAKGQRGEREVVKLLQEVCNQVCIRVGKPLVTLQRNQLATWQGGEDLAGLLGFAVEVKWQEIDYQKAWWDQCLAQALTKQAVPVLFYRVSRRPWRVKFRAQVTTPQCSGMILMDLTSDVDYFVEWFAKAFQETLNYYP